MVSQQSETGPSDRTEPKRREDVVQIHLETRRTQKAEPLTSTGKRSLLQVTTDLLLHAPPARRQRVGGGATVKALPVEEEANFL